MVFNRGQSGDRVSIELAKQVPLGEIRYTLDGAEPTAKSPVYTDVFEAPQSTTLKAMVFYDGEPLSHATTSVDLSADVLGQ
jgi:hexosaminidase